MPIDYSIHPAQRLVIARGRDIFTRADMEAYQREVWSRPEVTGFDELIDMTDVERIDVEIPTGQRMQRFAAECAALDPPDKPGKLVIVAPGAFAFGLGRQYLTYRELASHVVKPMRVVHELADALKFLELAPAPDMRALLERLKAG
jgi:hypothetical protein